MADNKLAMAVAHALCRHIKSLGDDDGPAVLDAVDHAYKLASTNQLENAPALRAALKARGLKLHPVLLSELMVLIAKHFPRSAWERLVADDDHE